MGCLSPHLGCVITGAALGPLGADIIPFPAVVEWAGELSAIGLALDAGLFADVNEVEEEDPEDFLATFFSGTLLSVLTAVGIGQFGLVLNAQNVIALIALIACMYPTGKDIAIVVLERGGVGGECSLRVPLSV